MDDQEIEAIQDVDKLKSMIKDYRRRFKMINEIMMNYGVISNDDMIGLIAKAIPPDCSQ